MAPLQEETRRIERVGMPSALSVIENVGSVAPLKQGERTHWKTGISTSWL
jgi:hypothetical protein